MHTETLSEDQASMTIALREVHNMNSLRFIEMYVAVVSLSLNVGRTM